MQFWDYNENRQRGTRDFPVEFHHIDIRHPRYTMPYHWHMESELLRVLQGQLTLTLDEREFTVHPGDSVFINGGVLHGGFPENCIYECIVFDMHPFAEGRVACRESLESFLSHKLLVQEYFPKQMQEFSNILCRLFQAVPDTTPGHELIALGYFYQFFGLILQTGSYTSGPSDPRGGDRRIRQLKQALEVIESQYDTDITLQELSQAAGMSPKYFCRFFRAMTHRTPIEYLHYYRMERASYLLISTDLPITQIALDCGFNDLSYFIRSFKKYKGTTPKKYRG